MLSSSFDYKSPVSIHLADQGQAREATIILFNFAPETPEPGGVSKQIGGVTGVGLLNNTRQILVSLGERDKFTINSYRQAAASLTKWISQFGRSAASIEISNLENIDSEGAFSALIEGLYLGAFSFSRLKSSNEPSPDIKFLIHADQNRERFQSEINYARLLIDAVNLERHWAHEPANVINPITLAERVKTLAEDSGLSFQALDENDLAKIEANGILSVGQGSKTPSRLIILKYSGKPTTKEKKPVVLVGKAITFDSGGYSLKDTVNIQGMKFDKCGGVTVVAVLKAVAALNIKTPVVGVIAAAENMISAQAYRPDDIITMLSKKTVEIITTDAEGRLVLADALTYTEQYLNPRVVIDLATLTGGVITAIGRVRAGLMSNNDELANALILAGEETHERLWRLPLDDDYFEQIKGDDADLKNSGGREGQPVIGGVFLKQFISEKIPWAHIDIAGVSDTPKETPYAPKGATGFGVRLLIHYLNKLQ